MIDLLQDWKRLEKKNSNHGLERHCKLQVCNSDWELTKRLLMSDVFVEKRKQKKSWKKKKFKLIFLEK